MKFGEARGPDQVKAFSKMKRRQRRGSDGRRPGSFRTGVLRVWSVEPVDLWSVQLWKGSLRPFHEIPEVKATFIASFGYYLASHYVDICFDV